MLISNNNKISAFYERNRSRIHKYESLKVTYLYMCLKRSFSSLNSVLKCFSGITIMIFRKFCMFKDLYELQVSGCQTDVCLVGAGGFKVFIHRAMLLLANHVQPHPVWHQLDPGEDDGKGFSATKPLLHYLVIVLN